jgi:hypothetical protein
VSLNNKSSSHKIDVVPGMDGHNRHRRLNDSLSHHDSHPKYPSQSQVGLPSSAGGGSGSRSERFHLSSTSSPQTPRGVGTSASYSYYQEPANSFSSSTNISAYGSEFGQEGRQQQSQQGFAGYNPNGMLFNVAQPNTQASVYDTTQQFGARQSAALSMMTPDVTSTYFGGADPSNTSASPSLHQPAHGASSSSANVYQQQRQQHTQHPQQPSSALSYSSSMQPGVGVPGQEAAESADHSVHEEPDYSETALEEKWISYQRQLGTVFQNITNGALESASETLLTISDWLLSQVVDLGTYETLISARHDHPRRKQWLTSHPVSSVSRSNS